MGRASTRAAMITGLGFALASAAASCTLFVDSGGLSGDPDGGTTTGADGSDLADATSADGAPADARSDGGNDGGGDSGPSTNPACETEIELELCLRFEDSATDESAYGRSPASSANIAYEDGRHGRAAVFDTSPLTDLTYDNALFYDAKTIELWVKPSSTARMIVVDVRDDFALIIEGPSLRCRQPELVATIALTPNAWNHVACTTDAVTLRAYVNGQPAGTLESTNITDNNGYTGIGQDSPNGGLRYEGSMDDLRIWRSTRSAQQIADSASR